MRRGHDKKIKKTGKKMKICICGGGNLGHVTAGFLAAQPSLEVSLPTRCPERWSRRLTVATPQGENLYGTLKTITDNAETAATGADMLLLCLPGFAIREELRRIAPFVPAHAPVGSVISSTGFFFQAADVLSPAQPVFGFQRVPFIARTVQYGHSARLMGYKPSLRISVERLDDKENFRQLIEQLFQTPTVLLGSHYEASLTNSNPLLHPARLYTLWKDWHPGIFYPRQGLFYEEWTEEAAELYIQMDHELQLLLQALPVTPGCIPSVLDYYESGDAVSLAAKLRSIKAFQGILSPMVQTPQGYVPDVQSRYFTEDFPYGLAILQHLCHEHHIHAPYINKVHGWGNGVLKAE